MKKTISLDSLQKAHGEDVESELGLKIKGTNFSHGEYRVTPTETNY
ncbi:hypothetical protein [Levilactobacillus spicheri]|nr:hypothetical protein [Levilactobacillus spicheri]